MSEIVSKKIIEIIINLLLNHVLVPVMRNEIFKYLKIAALFPERYENNIEHVNVMFDVKILRYSVKAYISALPSILYTRPQNGLFNTMYLFNF